MMEFSLIIGQTVSDLALPIQGSSPGDPVKGKDKTARKGDKVSEDDELTQWVAQTLTRLGSSHFRAGFSLSSKDRSYARMKGKDTIDRHAHELLAKRVGPALPPKDGKQTPYRGHPVFTAQHATATCCRGCIQRWHHIPKGRPLTEQEVDRLAALVMAWIERDLTAHPA